MDQATGNTANFIIESGSTNLDHDAGYMDASSVATIGNFVWEDSNFNGLQDPGELGIAGATIQLFDSSSNFISQTTSDPSGFFSFNNVVPGDYFLEFILPTGFVFTDQDVGSDDTIDSDADPVNGRTDVRTLVAAQIDNDWDAGAYNSASIGDRVWEDTNMNGLQDAGELGIENVLVNLFDEFNVLITSELTDFNGNYEFTDLNSGFYRVQFIKPGGYVMSPQDVGGNDAIDSDADVNTGITDLIFLAPGQSDNRSRCRNVPTGFCWPILYGMIQISMEYKILEKAVYKTSQCVYSTQVTTSSQIQPQTRLDSTNLADCFQVTTS